MLKQQEKLKNYQAPLEGFCRQWESTVLQSSAEIEIKTHRKVALELLTRPTARMLWQPDLERAILMEGEVGQVGAVTALVFSSGESTRRSVETIASIDPRTSLHVVQSVGDDEYHLYYGFCSVRRGYLRVSLTIEFKPGGTLGTLRGYFDKKVKTLADEQLNVLNEFIIQQNFKRKIRSAKRKAAAELG